MKVTITSLDNLPLPYVVDFSENEKVDNSWSEKELECLFKENIRELHDQVHEGNDLKPALVYNSDCSINHLLFRASKDQIKRVRGQHLFKIVFNEVTYAVKDTGKVHSHYHVTEYKTQPMDTSNPQETVMSKETSTNKQTLDPRLQEFEDHFMRGIDAVAADQVNTERELFTLKERVQRIEIMNSALEQRVNMLMQATFSTPSVKNNSWSSFSNSAFNQQPPSFGDHWTGFSQPQNPNTNHWIRPAQPAKPSNWPPFGPGDKAPPANVLLTDLPAYPHAVVQPQDLSICNGAVTCCVGTHGELYRLTKDTIIAHVVPWEELSPVGLNKVDWCSNKGKWGVFKESAGKDIPEGTLVYANSVRSTGLIVRYPGQKYDFKIINL